MKKLHTAFIQMNCEKGAIKENVSKMEKYISDCHKNGIDIVCFPEMNITGYNDPHKYPDAIITLQHDSIKRILKLSEIYNLCIIAGFIEHNPKGKPFITQFAAQTGKVVCKYRKITIKDEEAEWFTPGDSISIFGYKGIKLGIRICADIDDERIFKEYAHKGVFMIFECAAPGLYGEQENRNWESGFNWWKNNCLDNLGRYAAENKIFIGVATQAGRTKDEDFPGGGYVFDPNGKCIYETSDWNPGILYTTMTINKNIYLC